MKQLVDNYGVVGFVVGWPLEPSGLPGASCGKTLHFLDRLMEERIMSPSVPVTLWDQRRFTHGQFEELKHAQDKWGRSAAFCLYASGMEAYDGNMYITKHGKGSWENDNDNNEDNDRKKNADNAPHVLKHFLNAHYKRNEDDDDFTRRLMSKSSSQNFQHLRIIQAYEHSGACIESSIL